MAQAHSQALRNTIENLRTWGRSGIMAALSGRDLEIGTSKPTPVLPTLQGEALARHHLALAIEAMRGPGVSKPDGFRKVRLLLNRLEQDRAPTIETPVSDKEAETQVAAISRRARLLNRAFESRERQSAKA